MNDVCVVVSGPLVGTPDCANCVVYMLPALHRPAFYYLRGSWVRGLVTSVFVLNPDWIHIACFGYLCSNVFCCIHIVCLRGEGLPVSGGVEGPFH